MIKLYTGPNCSACTKLKGRLDGLGIPKESYEEANVNDAAHRAAVVALGFRGIPLLVKYVEGTEELVGTLMGASYGDAEYKEFFA